MSEALTGEPAPTGWRGLVADAVRAGLRVSLKVSPRPMVWVIRRFFAKNGAQLAVSMRALAPVDVATVIDERYDDHPDARLDVYTPGSAVGDGRRLPTVVWTHGGGWVAGSKDELRDYLKMIAAAGFTVAAVEYPLAPGERYPSPARHVMAALRHLQASAERLHVDPSQVMLAGDSAGAHITAQVAAIVTNPGYAGEVGIESTISVAQLRGVVLCCGPYDLALAEADSPMQDFVLTVAWAYSGTRDWRANEYFLSTMAVTKHVTAAFPPAFITVGNADPLAAHSRALTDVLRSKGVEVDTLFYPDDHQPPLGHEYQLDLSLDDARTALQRLISFLQRHREPAEAT